MPGISKEFDSYHIGEGRYSFPSMTRANKFAEWLDRMGISHKMQIDPAKKIYLVILT